MEKKVYRGKKSLIETIEKLSKPFFMQSGGNFTQKIFFNWQYIIGEKFAKNSAPAKIDFPPNRRSNGTLHIKVDNPALSLALAAMESSIVSKISQFFGFQVVSRIRVVVDLKKPSAQSAVEQQRPKIAIQSSDLIKLSQIVNELKDPSSKASLENLISAFCDLKSS